LYTGFTEFFSIQSHFPGSVAFLPGLVAPGLVAPGLVAPALVGVPFKTHAEKLLLSVFLFLFCIF
jgi:hypothetical protein